jgi:hypothetical protein
MSNTAIFDKLTQTAWHVEQLKGDLHTIDLTLTLAARLALACRQAHWQHGKEQLSTKND